MKNKKESVRDQEKRRISIDQEKQTESTRFTAALNSLLSTKTK